MNQSISYMSLSHVLKYFDMKVVHGSIQTLVEIFYEHVIYYTKFFEIILIKCETNLKIYILKETGYLV